MRLESVAGELQRLPKSRALQGDLTIESELGGEHQYLLLPPASEGFAGAPADHGTILVMVMQGEQLEQHLSIARHGTPDAQ